MQCMYVCRYMYVWSVQILDYVCARTCYVPIHLPSPSVLVYAACACRITYTHTHTYGHARVAFRLSTHVCWVRALQIRLCPCNMYGMAQCCMFPLSGLRTQSSKPMLYSPSSSKRSGFLVMTGWAMLMVASGPCQR